MSTSTERQIEYIDRVMPWCFAGLAVILPVAHTMTIRSIFMFLPAMLWIYKMILKREFLFLKTPMTLPVALFAAVAVFSLFTAVSPRYTLRELRGEMATDFLLFFLVLNNVRDKKGVDFIITGLLLGGLANGVFSVFDYFLKGGDMFDYSIKVSGLTAGYISYSVYLVSIMPFAVYRALESRGKERGFYIFLALLNALMLFLTHQRGALVAVFVQALLFFWFIKRWLLIAMLALAAVSVFVMPKNLLYHGDTSIDVNVMETEHYKNTINSRIALWRFTLKEISEHPFTGIGFGRHSFSEAFSRFKGTEHWHSLNTFLNITIQLGVQGLLVFLLMLFMLARAFTRGIMRSGGPTRYLLLAFFMSMAGFFARNMFDDHYVDDNGAMFWVLMGLGVYVSFQAEKLSLNGRVPDDARSRDNRRVYG
ncbi:MAG: O-antigen ligase family protein [Deltaproteobacteria bacterium]